MSLCLSMEGLSNQLLKTGMDTLYVFLCTLCGRSCPGGRSRLLMTLAQFLGSTLTLGWSLPPSIFLCTLRGGRCPGGRARSCSTWGWSWISSIIWAGRLHVWGPFISKSPEIFVKLFSKIIVKSRFGIFVIFEIIWDQNPFNFLFKNIVLFEYDYKYNYVVIVGGVIWVL